MLKLTRQYFTAHSRTPDGQLLPCPMLRVIATTDSGDLFPAEIFVYQARTLTTDPRTGDPCTAVASLVQMTDLPANQPIVGTADNRSIPMYRKAYGQWYLNNENEAATLWDNILEDVAQLLANWNAVNSGLLEAQTVSFDFANPAAPSSYMFNQISAQGVLQLIAGQQIYTVTFSTEFSEMPTLVIGSFTNTVDSDPEMFGYGITSRTTTGFTLVVSAVPDTNNYTFNWLAIK